MIKSTLFNPLITIITVVFNDKDHIEETILSVISQSYKNIEYIIIDGGSIDGTVDIIKRNENKLSYWISEKDRGIYNAMNKGIRLATGSWIIFMNSGDVFYDNKVLSNISYVMTDCDLIYSDTYFSNEKIFTCDINRNRIIHQSLIYKKNLHEEFGLYLEGKGVSISDYIFFMQCKVKKWKKVDFIISKFNVDGVSSNLNHFKQKIAVDVIFNNISRTKGALILLIHPIYNKLKRLFA